MDLLLSDPAVQAAIVQSVGGVLAATVAGVCAVLVGKRFVDQNRLREKLELAIRDIEFLLAVESVHCADRLPERQGSIKQRMRKLVRERGLEWSGRFTPGRSKHLRR